MDFNLSTYFPIFLYLAVIVGFAVSALVVAHLLGPGKRTPVKQMPYESGMDPIGDARQRFDVRYYLVAIVFLLFDVELLFLYPWAVAQWSYGTPAVHTVPIDAPAAAQTPDMHAIPRVLDGVPPGFRTLVFFEILVFVAILVAAFAYAWRKGVFEWR